MSRLSLLSYPCLQSILKHFEVNHRILLAQKLPSIAILEKPIPLKIQGSITLNSHSTTIDWLSYYLQVIRYDPENEKYKSFESWLNNGITCDLDSDGNPIPGPPLAPGDFDFGGEENMANMFVEFLSLDSNVMENGKMIRKKKEYQYFLKFSVKESGEKGTNEYIKYDQNFHIAVKYLNSKLLAGRPPISVGTLKIDPEKYLRLPTDLKFDKCDLEVRDIYTGLETIRSLLTPSSFPINYVSTDRITVADNEFLKGVEKLHIENYNQKVFPPLPYKQVRFAKKIDEEELAKIWMDWKSGEREIGTLCAIELGTSRDWKRFMDFWMELDGAELGEVDEIRKTNLPHCVIFNINDTSEINIYCTRYIDADDFFTMQMKIEPKGFATRI